MPPPRPSIRDLARETGLSITTVSQALNGTGRVPESTRARVQEAADKLGYRANVHARRLVTGRNTTVAVQVTGGGDAMLVPQSGYFVELLNGASVASSGRGYSLVLAPPVADRQAVDSLAIDGVLLVDPTGEEGLLKIAREAGLPVVTAGRIPGEGHGTASVDNDHRSGTRRVLEHFADTGRRRPALLTSAGEQSYLADALDAYRDWCAGRGLDPLVTTVEGAATPDAAEVATLALLDAEHAPDAVFATLDQLAVGALRAAGAREVAVPGRLAIAALTDSELLRATKPRITALDLRPGEIGATATELLVDLVEGRHPREAHAVVPSRLLARESTIG